MDILLFLAQVYAWGLILNIIAAECVFISINLSHRLSDREKNGLLYTCKIWSPYLTTVLVLSLILSRAFCIIILWSQNSRIGNLRDKKVALYISTTERVSPIDMLNRHKKIRAIDDKIISITERYGYIYNRLQSVEELVKKYLNNRGGA